MGQDAPANLALIDLHKEWTVNEHSFFGMSKNSSFLGESFKGKVVGTFKDGKLCYEDNLPWK